MRHYKKRIIAVCLASFMTVLGSFGSTVFRNSLLDLKINNNTDGLINVTAFTQKDFQSVVKTEKIDDTYYITLPETTSELKNMPDIAGFNNVQSINVQTYPYTNEQAGYTKIILKTQGDTYLNTSTALYLSSSQSQSESQYNSNNKTSKKRVPVNRSYWEQHNQVSTENVVQKEIKTDLTNTSQKQQSTKTKTKSDKSQTKQQSNTQVTYNDVSTNFFNERLALIIGIIVLSLITMFIYFISKDKMASIVGERNNFELDDNEEEKDKKKSKTRQIKNTINKLDKDYSNKANSTKPQLPINEQQPEPKAIFEEEHEEAVIVDLDSLYNQKRSLDNNPEAVEESQETQDNNDNDDLAEFLDTFTLDVQEDSMPEESFNEEAYEKTINNDNLKFSNNDNEMITQLIQNEISDDTLNNISDFMAPDNMEEKAPDKQKILENLLGEYTIKQNISFSKDDVEAIKQIMDVELDGSFVKDLSTNRQRTQEMQKELANTEKKPHKTSEILTLKVKDVLPDLSKELQKLGNKRIESDAKPEVVYFSEGYEVSKLSVNEELSDISKALQTKDATAFRPSDEIPFAEYGYDVQTLSIKDDLPDLSDFKTNPQKYEDKKTKEPVNEAALLQSIANVKFKPFYDDVQEEMNQFEGFEIINKDNDDVANYIEHDEPQQKCLNLDLYNTTRKKPVQTQKVNDDAQKLLQLIEEQQTERQNKKIESEKVIVDNNNAQDENKKIDQINRNDAVNKTKKNTQEELKTIEIDGDTYNIKKSVKCENSVKCYLTQNDKGHTIIGSINGRYKILKHYDNLASESIQARVNEKNDSGKIQYIIRVSIHKFIIDVTKSSMEFVMDLC